MSRGVNDFQIGRILSHGYTLAPRCRPVRPLYSRGKRPLADNDTTITAVQSYLFYPDSCVLYRRYKFQRVGFGYDTNNISDTATHHENGSKVFRVLARAVVGPFYPPYYTTICVVYDTAYALPRQ